MKYFSDKYRMCDDQKDEYFVYYVGEDNRRIDVYYEALTLDEAYKPRIIADELNRLGTR